MPMRGRARLVEGRVMRHLAALVVALVIVATLAPSAGAQSTSLVTARVAPILGVFIAGDGVIGNGNTVDATVRRQRVGRTLLITVIPRI
jgi:hypothetical protein